jgi:ribonuclease P protein component
LGLFLFFETDAFLAKQYTLGKSERLKSRKIIEQLFKEGKAFNLAPFRVYYLFAGKDAQLQFGTGASTRNFKKAVDRNRIKRLIREAWRLQKLPLENILKEQNRALSVFIIYTSKELPVYTDIAGKMEKTISKLSSLIIAKQ